MGLLRKNSIVCNPAKKNSIVIQNSATREVHIGWYNAAGRFVSIAEANSLQVGGGNTGATLLEALVIAGQAQRAYGTETYWNARWRKLNI